MIDQTSLSFQENGAPYSDQFDDIYFDTESGCQQSEEIFLTTNNIYQRLLSATPTLTIAETGFGTGLNFLLTLVKFQQAIKHRESANNTQTMSIRFISVEKYPLTLAQLTKSLAILPELKEISSLLLAQYPEKTTQKHYQFSFFQEQVILDLYIGDAADSLAQLPCSKKGLINAWYLDGFSPAKNPDMWSEALFEQIARLSKEQATLSTFTVAGFVKRHLINSGFRTEKRPSKGKKKEVLFAVYQQSTRDIKGYQIRPTIIKPQHVSIIGGGVASACAAYALTQKGIKVTLYCQDEAIAQGASSNAIGALYPLLHQQRDDISDFYQQAFWHAKKTYQSLIEQGFHFEHQWCGLLELSYKEALQKRQQQFEQLNTWPAKLIHGVTSEQASTLANIPLMSGGLFMPEAGWISPPDLVKQLFNASLATNKLKIKNNVKVASLKQLDNNKWQLLTNKGEFDASVVVVCGGADVINLNYIKELPLTPVRGQVTNMAASTLTNKLATVVCHKGYLTPANKGVHCIGATFEKETFATDVRSKDNDYNLAMLNKCIPEFDAWSENDVIGAKARLRCTTPDHMPVVGAMPDVTAHKALYPHLAKDKNWRYQEAAPVVDNLYLMTGLGARGLCTAPLLADILAADLCNTPYPVDNKLLFNLSANRFVIRDISRRKFE